MNSHDSELERFAAAKVQRRELCKWFDELPLGRSLQTFEANHLRAVLFRLYGTVAVQLGKIGELDIMDGCNAPTRILLDLEHNKNASNVNGRPDELPFESKSVDVAILPHTLDFAESPHQILREVHRVLCGEGHVVITGFNPISVWGLRHLVSKRRQRIPWNANFLALSRIKDWLALLGFEFTQGKMMYYRPPLQNTKIMQRLAFLDNFGDRWLPLTAAVYMVVAKKRVVGMTPIQPKWEQKNVAVAGFNSQPAARVIYPHIPHWRLHRDG